MKRRVTIADLAKHAGVSTGTVTRALGGKGRINEQTRERILEAATEIGYTPNRIARRLAHGNTRIALICEKGIPQFYDDLIRGANQAFRDLEDYYVEGRIVRVDMDDVHAFYAQMDELAADDVHGLVVCPGFESEVFGPALKAALRPEMWLATVASDLPDTRRAFCIRHDAVTAGRMAAELLYRMLGPNADVAIFTRRYDSFIHHKTIEGFKQMNACYPLNIVGVFENYDDCARADLTTERLLKTQPNVKGIYVNSANSTPVCRRVVEMGLAGRVKIIASDLFEGMDEYIEKDVVQATLFQDPFTQARTCVTRLYRAMVEGAVYDREKLILPQVVMRSNLQTFSRYLSLSQSQVE